MSSIILLRPDKAGDLVKTLPALRALIEKVPDIKIHLIVSLANESLLKYEPQVSYSVLPSSWEKIPFDDLKLKLSLELNRFSFYSGVNLLCDPFPIVENLLNAITADKKFSVTSDTLSSDIWPLTFKRSSPKERDESLNIAEILGQALSIELLSTTHNALRAPQLGDEDTLEAARSLGEKTGNWIGICPFAGTNQRTHPLAKWKTFIKSMEYFSKYEKIILLGAPSDHESLEEIKKRIGHSPHLTLAFPSCFRALGAYLKRCDQVIAVDSGPLHLSLALGIPSLGFLSGGDHKRWFSQTSVQDKIVPRGIWDRFPSTAEMCWHFYRWEKRLSKLKKTL
ncbi:MAG: lipopolysaccharide heptosyltransferase family protein [Bdellovibrionales bacterium]|nr:lipopolysaccharide heptosyltransferase family protein [Bdellovibrionales bacterium]